MAATLESGGRPGSPPSPLGTAAPPAALRPTWFTLQRMLNAAGFVLLVLGAAVMLLPIFWTVSTSVKSLANVFTLQLEWWAAQPKWQNYVDAWNQNLNPFGRYFLNRAIVATATAGINALLSGFAGNALAKVQLLRQAGHSCPSWPRRCYPSRC